MSPEPDTAREVTPVVMFDDQNGAPGRRHRDYRPINEYVKEQREQEARFVKPEQAQDADADDPTPEQEVAPPVVDAPDPEPEGPVTEGEPEPTEEESPNDPPEEAPEQDEAGGDTDGSDDDIPSPWDEDTSD